MNIIEHDFMLRRWNSRFLIFINPNSQQISWRKTREIEGNNLCNQRNLRIMLKSYWIRSEDDEEKLKGKNRLEERKKLKRGCLMNFHETSRASTCLTNKRYFYYWSNCILILQLPITFQSSPSIINLINLVLLSIMFPLENTSYKNQDLSLI